MAKRPSKPKRKVKVSAKKTAPKKVAAEKRKTAPKKKTPANKTPKKKAPAIRVASPALATRPPPPPADAFDDPTEEVAERDIVGVIEEHGVLDQLSEHNVH